MFRDSASNYKTACVTVGSWYGRKDPRGSGSIHGLGTMLDANTVVTAHHIVQHIHDHGATPSVMKDDGSIWTCGSNEFFPISGEFGENAALYSTF